MRKIIEYAGFLSILFFLLLVCSINPSYSQSDEDCMMCHEDPELTTERRGRTVSMFVDLRTLNNSVHKDVECSSCHPEAGADDFPHAENLPTVECGFCHDIAQERFDSGIHGQALRLNALYAPDCKECHGTHDILSKTSPKSRTYKMNIPILCGKCHREGAPVARTYNISEHNILENYSQGIHGEGLFKRGLIVSATCNDCHGNHLVLPHTSINSSISVKNIAKTCMKCHAEIEKVHTKVIKRELWEKEPGAIPACTDCHPPHKENVKNIVTTMSDRSCIKCHAEADVHKVVNDSIISLRVDKTDIAMSVHKNIPCVKCHSDVTPQLKRPCETAFKVDCSNCHAEVSNVYNMSGHGQAYFRKDENAPYCTDCHGTHKTKSRYDDTSPTYRTAIPQLCGDCHSADSKEIEMADLKEVDAFMDYSKSVHGKGLTEKGLLPSAVCTDCHTTHFELKESDERSSVNPKNIPATCATCHKGIYDEYIASDHGINSDDDTKKYPTCADCHSAHKISDIHQDKFMGEVTYQCGSCHEDLSETYLETYHGKAYTLGYLKSAKCSDCHGAHSIYNSNNPKSSISSQNIVETCKQCHPDANARFTGYLTHATHHDKTKYPILYYTFWGMTFLLIGVFGFFGLHLLLWLPRSIQGIKNKRKHREALGPKYYIKRFNTGQRMTHLFVIISFLLLALTGMMLKFAGMPWASTLAKLLGGVHAAGNIHRFAAVITFGYFIFHVISLIRLKIKRKIPLGQFIFGKNSLMFNKQDLKDFWATMKWFFGMGPRPEYGRWTYWEKFDYFAVFWGVAVIGFSGLILWFPEFFTQVFPGWFINVAMIIHSDEALLAVGFIFTIHFFNTHLRPDAFPMDTVIFTGTVPYEEFKHDRPREFEELKKSGKLKKVIIKKEKKGKMEKYVKPFGYAFLFIGLSIVILIIYTMLFGYN
ncbi:MAG: cytochrome c3 family protein [Bacteroidales bacterium]|jgi:predicted CXXCH cytochrome family protein|nr:cytochrome c3 family protein [Bacteroidales bacterium]